LRIGRSDQSSQCLLAGSGDMHERGPKLLFQRNAGTMTGERKTTLDQRAQAMPPRDRMALIVFVGRETSASASGLAHPSCFVAGFTLHPRKHSELIVNVAL
jgi:hypothetical protein